VLKPFLKIAVFTICLIPALWLGYAVYLAYTGGENLLGPDPAKMLSLETGKWAIWMLILALSITPLRYLFNKPFLWQFRRMIGLYALFYAVLHFTVFLAFLLQWQWGELSREIVERPYITVGFIAFVLLVPLGLTSTQYAQRKLGRNWKRLHRLVYLTALLAVVHVVWIVRSSIGDAVLYGVLVLVSLSYRLLVLYFPGVKAYSLGRIGRFCN
jgi:sulfoxide reductase heme-binding subunit YedZ